MKSGLLLLPLFLVSCSPDPEETEPETRPDVVLVVIDTMRADRMGCYGYPRPTSPVLDQIAEEGALFLEARSQCSWTLPSMASMMTGEYLTNPRDIYPEGSVPLAQRFKEAGYRTIGMVGNVILTERLGYGAGFDIYDSERSSPQDRPRVGLCRTIDRMVDKVEPMIDQALEPEDNGTRPPLFLYFHPMDPHSPFLDYPQFDDELPLAGAAELDDLSWQREYYAEHGARPLASDPDWSRAWNEMNEKRGLYDQEVRFTDHELGRLFEGLRTRGILDNAILAIAGDHGESLWDNLAQQESESWSGRPPKHYFHGEHDVYLRETLLKTPLILWGTGIEPTRIDTPVENIDLYPTLLELTGLESASTDGTSLVPFLEGEGTGKEYLFARVRQHVSIYEASTGLKLTLPTGSGTVIGSFEIDTEPLLNDLRQSPTERENIYDDRPADVERLKAALVAWGEQYPTEIHLQREKDPKTIEALQALGYLGDIEDDEEDE